jgi:hypothetical protein
MTNETKKCVTERLKETALEVANGYDGNIKIQIDVNTKVKDVKVQITETLR